MRTKRVALWVLVSAAILWAFVPAATSAVHAPAVSTAPGAHMTVMGQSTAPGCGYEHGPHGHVGTDGNGDDNNGGGSDEDHDHDCTEQNPE
jgi:hypothetical protein